MQVFAITYFSSVQSPDLSDHFPFTFSRILWPKWEQCLQLPKTCKLVPPETCWTDHQEIVWKRTIYKKKTCLISNVQLSLAHLVHNLSNITRTWGAKTYLSVQKRLLEISLNFFSQNIFEKFLVFVNWFFD